MLVAPTGVTLDSTAYIEGVPRFQNQNQPTEHFTFLRFQQSLFGSRVSALLLKEPWVVEGVKQDTSMFFMPDQSDWTAEKLSEYLRQNVHFEPVKDTQLQRLVYSHPDKAFAKKFLSALYRNTDDLIRSDLRSQTAEFVSHIEKELKDVRHPTHREVLTKILMEQEQIRILTDLEKPFAALMAEPPVSSVKPVWPKKSIVLPVALFLGFALGFFLFNVRQALK